jgi:hypothetical protein
VVPLFNIPTDHAVHDCDLHNISFDLFYIGFQQGGAPFNRKRLTNCTADIVRDVLARYAAKNANIVPVFIALVASSAAKLRFKTA